MLRAALGLGLLTSITLLFWKLNKANKRDRNSDRNDLHSSQYIREKATAIKAVRLACQLALKAQADFLNDINSLATQIKTDQSPVTVADFGAQAVVNLELEREFPSDPVIAEENSQLLVFQRSILDKVTRYVCATLNQNISPQRVIEAINYAMKDGNDQAVEATNLSRSSNPTRFWTLDPIDGTKGYLRKEQYAIALALIVDGRVVLGVLGCPNLPVSSNGGGSEASQRGVIFVGVKDQPAFSIALNDPLAIPHHIRVSPHDNSAEAIMTESVEASHSSHDKSAIISKLLRLTRPPLRMDSQAKYGVIARGEAQIYLRLPVNAKYEEKIWDHAAGLAVITSAGGQVTDLYGRPLDFTRGFTLSQNTGILATNGVLHQTVLQAVRRALNSDL